MNVYESTEGKGRVKVSLSAFNMGDDIVVAIHNENAHIGAIALGEYARAEQRASCSVLTRLGHKDDVIAQKAAYQICKQTRKTTCVTAGVHLDGITEEEIGQIVQNSERLVEQFIASVLQPRK